MRRRRVWAAALVLALALTMAGCGEPAAESPSPQPSTPGPSVIPSTPAETATPTPKPINDPYVYTDWSKLEDDAPRPTVYTRWYGEFTDHLIPSDDYGPLIPFQGTAVTDASGYGDYAMTGLMTLDGKVVVDPVYGEVVAPSGGGFYPALLLSRYAGDGTGDLFGGYRDVLSYLCAGDGSWVTEHEYHFPYGATYGYPLSDSLLGLRDGNVLALLDLATGEELLTIPLAGLSKEACLDIVSYATLEEGLITSCVYEGYDEQTRRNLYRAYCWDDTGVQLPLPEDVMFLHHFSDGLCPAQQSGTELWGYIDRQMQWAIEPQFEYARPFEDGFAQVQTQGYGTSCLINTAGERFGEPVYHYIHHAGNEWYLGDNNGNISLVLDKNGREIDSPVLHCHSYFTDSNFLYDGWVTAEEDGHSLLVRGEQSWPIPSSSLRASSIDGKLYLSGRDWWTVWDPKTQPEPDLTHAHSGRLWSVKLDPITAEPYCIMDLGMDANDRNLYQVRTADDRLLFDALPAYPHLYGGRCFYTTYGEGRAATLLGPGGQVLFHKSLTDTGD